METGMQEYTTKLLILITFREERKSREIRGDRGKIEKCKHVWFKTLCKTLYLCELSRAMDEVMASKKNRDEVFLWWRVHTMHSLWALHDFRQ